jgi:glycine betaine/proline transport system substrate-binding protein
LGDFEQAHIVVNIQFSERMPVIANFLSRVRFNLRDVETLMDMNQVLGSEPYENAIRWINQNTNRINRWLM